MSQAEVERFVSDLKDNEGLRGELSEHASGVGSVVEFAKEKGYDISADEARSYIQSQSERELSDDELDAVAGGKGHAHVGESAVAAVQTVAASTTQTVAAETTVTATAEAVAAVVIVLT